MSVADLPQFLTTIPGPLNSGWGLDEQAHFRTNPVQSGPPVNEFLSADTSADMPVNFSFNKAEYSLFRQWWRETINFGTAPFSMEVFNGGMGDTCETLVDDDYVTVQCQFIGGLSRTRNGRRTELSGSMVVSGMGAL